MNTLPAFSENGAPPVAKIATAVPAVAFAVPADGYGVPHHVLNPDLPDAVEAWNGLRGIMTGFMAVSVTMLFFSSKSFVESSNTTQHTACLVQKKTK